MGIKLYHGDCLEVMKKFPDNYVDSICCDPPYGLSFMGKKWDYDVPSVEIWREALRVLKPGGYLLSFAGTRTQHRMCVNIEDAGFEIRDMIAWVYGSGFPKSLNIGKAVDKRGGVNVSWFGKWLRQWREDNNISQKEVAKLFPSKTGVECRWLPLAQYEHIFVSQCIPSALLRLWWWISFSPYHRIVQVKSTFHPPQGLSEARSCFTSLHGGISHNPNNHASFLCYPMQFPDR